MKNKFMKIINDPIRSFYYILSKVCKDFLYKRYSNLSTNNGIDKLYFILSFDCDTHEDAKVVTEVHNKLSAMGVLPVYAVPGQMLEQNSEIYKNLSSLGSEFMNHGYFEHVYFDKDMNDYNSNFFYNELPLSKIEEDIRLGDKVVTEIIGKKPLGYRAPHFGVFQLKKQLKFIHNILTTLNYKYSSSAVPYYGYRYGAKFNNFGLEEFAVTGMPDRLMPILDSWGYYKAPDKVKDEVEYKKDIIVLVNYFIENNLNGIINLYADPLHIHNKDNFFEAIEILNKRCTNTNYSKLVEKEN